MSAARSEPFLLAFVGYTDAARGPQASAFEDAVLTLLEPHGARLVYRGRRAAGQDDALPLEVHLIWFPSRVAFESYLADDRRAALIEQFGEVFTVKHAVELDSVAGLDLV